MSYKAPPYTLQPGQRVTVQVMGREVAVIEADKDFLIATNDGEPEFITAGLQLSPEGGFHNIVMRNPHPDAINVRLGITDGAIKDNRASVSTVLPVRDPTDLSSFSDVIAQMSSDTAALLAMMQNEVSQRNPLSRLGENFAFGAIPSSPVVFIDPVINTAGAIIRTASLRGVSNSVSIYADTAPPSAYGDQTKRCILDCGASTNVFLAREIYLQPGIGFYGIAPASDNNIAVTWDNL